VPAFCATIADINDGGEMFIYVSKRARARILRHGTPCKVLRLLEL
jgi:hypothetical protein